MNEQTGSAKGYRFTGWHMAACMAAFFGVIIAVNITMAFTAANSWTGLVVKNSYVASQKFNKELALAKAQAAKGWVSDLTYRAGLLEIDLKDRAGTALPLSDARVFIGRPAFEQQDQVFELVNQQGRHTAQISLATGEWSLRIEGMVHGSPYRRDARILVDKKQTGILQ